MNTLDDTTMTRILQAAKVIAVVGLSPKPGRASYRVAHYLQQAGYRIIPIRPGGMEIFGEKSYPSLKEIPGDVAVDIVDVFRRADQTPPIAHGAVAIGAGLLWLQSGIVNEDAMKVALRGGLRSVQDLCLMVEHRRLLGGG
ncbi:MAG: CoA-binding protein [Magnetococcales bacterium]|nr:CoA-binding protein [Magnetococcales bacterium]